MLDFGKCLSCGLAGLVGTFCQCRDHFLRMCFEICSPLSYRSQELIENCKEELFDFDISETAPAVVSFELIEILVLRQILFK